MFPPTGERAFSIVELLVAMAVVAILALIVVPRLIMQFERARQRDTVAEMRSLATALATYRLDRGGYPTGGLQLLVPEHYGTLPEDGWGHAFLYTAEKDGCAYTLKSLGADGKVGPAPPDPWLDAPFGVDLVLANGVFLQAPGEPAAMDQLPQIIARECS